MECRIGDFQTHLAKKYFRNICPVFRQPVILSKQCHIHERDWLPSHQAFLIYIKQEKFVQQTGL